MTVFPDSRPFSTARLWESSRLLVSLVLALAGFSAPASADEVVRIMAANTSSGNGQDYDPGEGIRIFKGLRPDVILIQEFNYLSDSPTDFRNFVDNAFGTEFQYFREPGNEQIPNGIISRYPIVQAGEWADSNVSNRDFAWARIDIPGDKDLWAVSVHLLTSGTGERNSEATALRNYIQSMVPAADYLVIGGDFNTDSFSESALGTLSAVVDTSGRSTDQLNKTGTNASRSKPYDHVLPDPDLSPREIPLAINGHGFTYPNGLVFDSRVFTPLSAVSPVLAGDSGASGMQHMAVIRDFLIPTDTNPSGEPASHVTNFTGTSTTGSISLSWTDATTLPAASGYLIKAGTDPAITAPVDGVAETPDTDLADGSATLLVPTGRQSATFTGLPADTTYYFKIYPYASAPTLDYKVGGTVPTLTLATQAVSVPLPDAPVLAAALFPHSGGFTVTWDEVPGATDYRLDVSESPTFTGGSTILLSENFDAATTVPAGWTNSGTSNDTLGSHYGSGPNCRAFANGSSLVTPAVDFPGELKFFVDSSGGGNTKTATASYSIGNGAWLPLTSFAVSTDGNINTVDLTSSPDLSAAANVRFRFESSFNTWYLDDVTISSSGGPGFVPGYQDLSVGNTNHHAVSGLNPGTAYYYRVRATNAAGTGPASATDTTTTRPTGSPFSVWADDMGISPATPTGDFDHDSLTDFQEYLYGTDPRQPTSPSTPLRLSTGDGGFRITYRRSLAPGIDWIYQGNTDLSAIDTVLEEGTGSTHYRILSIVRFATYEEVTLTINTGGDPAFFFRLQATGNP